jgi:hypothetical protein
MAEAEEQYEERTEEEQAIYTVLIEGKLLQQNSSSLFDAISLTILRLT